MSQESLTARYRPQTFAEVAGQDAVKTILSRAAATDRVAPAYLFSGTRGVGKTTIARIFAKAVNCARGPAAEPCNRCPFCRQITQGTEVDVVEIDGASNTGVDNVRRLREDVGYAPLECRYKVIIIDEAHMLSKSAFNALLKTLEEPPGHVTFIMATTEPEKFPQTIVSRCQHYVFKRLSQAGLKDHLRFVVDREGVSADESALNLLARRGAGSVRDSMSLLSQVLALGTDRLSDAAVREVLGLAGQEIFMEVVQAIHDQDIFGLNRVLEELLDTGLDIGFFLRELVQCWRNLFLLSQAGDKAGELMDLPEEEVAAWIALAGQFSPAHIHAAWQMTLENQRRVLTSLEPGPALEMLLLNLAYLPRLMPLGRVSGYGPSSSASSSGDAAEGSSRSASASPAPRRASQPVPEKAPSLPPRESSASSSPSTGRYSASAPGPLPPGPRDWTGFLRHYGRRLAREKRPLPGLKQAGGVLREGELIITCASSMLAKGLMAQEKFTYLSELVQEYFGAGTTVRVQAVESAPRQNRADLKRNMLEHPVIKNVTEEFHARIMDVRPVKPAENGTGSDKDPG